MAHEILMPQLGLTMEEGTVSSWLKHEGDAVKAGEPIIEITTDKLTNEVNAEFDGTLIKIVAQEGEDVKVKGLLGYIGNAGEVVGGASPAPAAAAPVAAAPVAAAPVVAAKVSGNRVRISPLARKTAAKMGIDYSGIIGTGPSGRIVNRDILAASTSAPKAAAPVASAPVVPTTDDEVIKFTGMRKVVAQRMLQSHTEIPPVTQNIKVDVTELVEFRKMLIEKTGKKYSVNDLILKATAKALKNHPEMLVSYKDDGSYIQHHHINLGMAVALDAGLIVPVIRDADKISLEELSDKAKDLATRAKENKLGADEYKDSTFSVSNLGMFGIETFTPIVNQPNAAILGVCATEDELALDANGKLCTKKVMRLSCTFDHRLLDGAVVAKFEMDLRDILQAPISIVL